MKILTVSTALLCLGLAAPAFAQSTSGDTDAGNMGANPSPAASPATGTDTTATHTGETGMEPGRDLKSMLTDLVKDNQHEIQMGKLALQNAKSKSVKAFAKKLVSDHTAAAAKVKPIAEAKGIDVAALTGESDKGMAAGMSGAGDEDMNRLQAVKGAEFDREFASIMVDDHQKAISLLDQIKTAANGDKQVEKMDDQLKSTIKMHLKAAQALQKEVGSPRHETRGTDTDKDHDNDNDNDSGTTK